MKIGAVMVTYEALAAALGLPAGHMVTAVASQDAQDIVNRRLQVLVQGPQMPEHFEGGPPKFVTLHRDPSGRVYVD